MMLTNVLKDSVTSDAFEYDFSIEDTVALAGDTHLEVERGLDASFEHIRRLTDLYSEMHTLKETAPINQPLVDVYRQRASTLLREIEGGEVLMPSMEYIGRPDDEWAYAMEGVGDALKRVIGSFGNLVGASANAMSTTMAHLTSSSAKLEKEIDKQLAALSKASDEPSAKTLKVGNKRYVTMPDGGMRYPTAADIESFSELVLKWGDLSLLRKAISEYIEDMHEAGKRNNRSNRAEATQEAIIKHYGLKVDSLNKEKLSGTILGIFGKESLVGEGIGIGGMRIIGMAAINKDNAKSLGRLYVSDLQVAIDYKFIGRSTEIDAPNKQQVEETLKALSKFAGDLSTLKRELSHNKRALDDYKTSINDLSKLSNIDWTTLLIAQVAGSLSYIAIGYYLAKRYINTLANISQMLVRTSVETAAGINNISEKAINNLK